MASQQSGANPIYVVPQPPNPGKALSNIPVAAPQATNIGGIVVGPAASAGQILNPPGIRVPLGMVVRLRGNPANTGTAYAARLREDAADSIGDPIQPNTEIIFPVDNLAQVFIRLGAINDAVTISIRSE